MPAAENTASVNKPVRFLYLYALAVAAGSVAYVLFLTILLPGQATSLSGQPILCGRIPAGETVAEREGFEPSMSF
jgi:hypothetical protein